MKSYIKHYCINAVCKMNNNYDLKEVSVFSRNDTLICAPLDISEIRLVCEFLLLGLYFSKRCREFVFKKKKLTP